MKNSIVFLRCAIFLRSMLHTVETISAVCCKPRRSPPRSDVYRGDHFVNEYLGEMETEFENTLGCLSGAQRGSNYEK